MTDTPTPAALRAELERLIVTDLLGPADPHEQLPGRRSPVREWYLVGMLAPLGTIVDPGRNDGDDLLDGEEGGGLGRDDRPGKVVLFPSSMGFTAAVDGSCSTLRVTARWGRYEKIDNPDPTATGINERLWQRHPAGDSKDVELVEGDIGPFAPDPSQPQVVVKGRCRRTARCWLVTLFLVNGQDKVARNIDERWLFQVELVAEAIDGSAPFVGRQVALPAEAASGDDEVRHLDLLHREKVEFAVGHGVAVHAEVAPGDPCRATAVRTAVIPRSEVARVEAPRPDDPALDPAERDLLGRVVLDMEALSRLDGPAAASALAPLADAYDRWLDRQDARAREMAGDHAVVGADAVGRARSVATRLRAGIALLTRDPVGAEAFAFANHAMWQQRLHTLVAAKRRDDPQLPLADAEASVARSPDWSWRPFQLAFILVNLPALVDPTHPERRHRRPPLLPHRRRQDRGLPGPHCLHPRRPPPPGRGRRSLRRGRGRGAHALHPAPAHLTAVPAGRHAHLRLRGEAPRAGGRRRRPLGGHAVPHRHVGGRRGERQPEPGRHPGHRRAQEHGLGPRRPPDVAGGCPWCGEELDPARHAEPDKYLWRTLIMCGDSKGRCPFTARRSPREGIPVVGVDEEIYRLLPDLVIATADKFAQLPWQGATTALFGRVQQRCSRHGFRTPDLDSWGSNKEANSHPKAGDLPPAITTPCLPRRPPDLIIQDELHLIAGPLGSLFGLYETAIDEIASWDVAGAQARPKVVASTATIRRAADQAYNLFCRRLEVFPPQVLDAGDSFFALERPVEESPGRLYLGVCGMGQRFKSVQTRVFTVVMAAAQVLYEKHGPAADPWMTAVGYFSSLRELGGMRRMIDDEVANRLRRTERRGLANRHIYERDIVELTSRVTSSDIPEVLDRLAVPFTGTRPGKGERWPLSIALATNMISVGVDVARLGLMICSGQPKATAEYIQATSRVGRDRAGPGLVITLYNWARPRDLSHYETFEHYHQTYYRQVEALSVTPFARRALDRGLTALLVSEARHLRPEWNPKAAAQIVPVNKADFDPIARSLRERAELVAKQAAAVEVDHLVATRRDKWSKLQKSPGVTLAYGRGRGDAIDLLRSPESGPWTDFTVPNSLREVEVGANLQLREHDPSDDPAALFPDPPAEGAGEVDVDGGGVLAAEDADAEDADAVIDEAELST